MMLLPLLRPVQKQASRIAVATTSALDLDKHALDSQHLAPPPLGANDALAPCGMGVKRQTSCGSAGSAPSTEMLWHLTGPMPSGTVFWPVQPVEYWVAQGGEESMDYSAYPAMGCWQVDDHSSMGMCTSSEQMMYTVPNTSSLPMMSEDACSDRSQCRTGASRRQRRKQRGLLSQTSTRGGAASQNEVEEMRKAVAAFQQARSENRYAMPATKGVRMSKPFVGLPSLPLMPAPASGSEAADSDEQYPQQLWPATPESTPPQSPRASAPVMDTAWCDVASTAASASAEACDSETEQIVAELSGGDGPHRQALIAWIASTVWPMASTPGGCRIVQKALEVVATGERLAIAEQLRGHVQDASLSPHGNHVVQKCIVLLPPEKVQFILAELEGQAVQAARHRYGCRVLERLIEHFPNQQTTEIVNEVLAGAEKLSRHAFGNFVIQHILEHGTSEQKRQVADVLHADVFRLSKHRVASHVVKSALVHCDQEDRQRLMKAISADASELAELAHHHCGSFVVREMRRANASHNAACPLAGKSAPLANAAALASSSSAAPLAIEA